MLDGLLVQPTGPGRGRGLALGEGLLLGLEAVRS